MFFPPPFRSVLTGTSDGLEAPREELLAMKRIGNLGRESTTTLSFVSPSFSSTPKPSLEEGRGGAKSSATAKSLQIFRIRLLQDSFLGLDHHMCWDIPMLLE